MSKEHIPPHAWRAVDDWQRWNDLPPTCCYRLRLVDASGVPVSIPRLLKDDPSGLLYIGETGPDEDWTGPHRVAALASDLAHREITDDRGRTTDQRVVPAIHGVGKTFRATDLLRKLRNRWPGCSLQVAWEATTDIESLVSGDDVTNANAAVDVGDAKSRNRQSLPTTDGILSSSGKEEARRRERELLDGYEDHFGEPPPLNDKAGEFMRNKDQRTGQALPDSFQEHAEGEVQMGDAYEELKRLRGDHA